MSEFKNKTVDDSELTTMKEQINTLTKKFEQKEKIQKQASSWRVLEDRMVDNQSHIMFFLILRRSKKMANHVPFSGIYLS